MKNLSIRGTRFLKRYGSSHGQEKIFINVRIFMSLKRRLRVPKISRMRRITVRMKR